MSGAGISSQATLGPPGSADWTAPLGDDEEPHRGRIRTSIVVGNLVGVENNNFEDHGQRNARTLMDILSAGAISP